MELLAFMLMVLLGTGNSVIMGLASALVFGKTLGAIFGALSAVVSSCLFFWTTAESSDWSYYLSILWAIVALCVSAVYLSTLIHLGLAIVVSIACVGSWLMISLFCAGYLSHKNKGQ